MIVENRAVVANQSKLTEDFSIFEERSAIRRPYARIGFDTSPLWLSIGIASLPARRARLDRLMAEIYRQALACGAQGEVEVLVDDRPLPVTAGEKRQAILDRARGRFVTFVDADDWIAHNYMRRIVTAIRENPEADCVGLCGAMIVFDHMEVFDASLRSVGGVAQVDGARLRMPHHRTPIRREIALYAGFPAVDFGEDLVYAERVAPYLKTEVHAGDGVLYHRWYDPNLEVVPVVPVLPPPPEGQFLSREELAHYAAQGNMKNEVIE